MLIATSDFFRVYGIYLLIAAVIAVWSCSGAGCATPPPSARFHRLQLRVPLLGKLVARLQHRALHAHLQHPLGSSVPVLEAMRIAGEVVTNLPMRDAVAEAAARVREGAPIGRSLAVSRLFPPMTIHLISSGESSGELDSMLERAAISQERELDGAAGAPWSACWARC